MAAAQPRQARVGPEAVWGGRGRERGGAFNFNFYFYFLIQPLVAGASIGTSLSLSASWVPVASFLQE